MSNVHKLQSSERREHNTDDRKRSLDQRAYVYDAAEDLLRELEIKEHFVQLRESRKLLNSIIQKIFYVLLTTISLAGVAVGVFGAIGMTGSAIWIGSTSFVAVSGIALSSVFLKHMLKR